MGISTTEVILLWHKLPLTSWLETLLYWNCVYFERAKIHNLDHVGHKKIGNMVKTVYPQYYNLKSAVILLHIIWLGIRQLVSLIKLHNHERLSVALLQDQLVWLFELAILCNLKRKNLLYFETIDRCSHHSVFCTFEYQMKEKFKGQERKKKLR